LFLIVENKISVYLSLSISIYLSCTSFLLQYRVFSVLSAGISMKLVITYHLLISGCGIPAP